MSISVVISTFGDIAKWSKLGQRALESVYRQTVDPEGIYWNHKDTLYEARNAGASEAVGDWLLFLDADDELDESYVEQMAMAVAELSDAEPWLIQPATLGVVDGREDEVAVVIPTRDLMSGNFMVIGTLVRRDQFHRVGGFRDLEYAEDWDLWIRCVIDGARCRSQPRAIYRVHVNGVGRNSGDRDTQVRVFNEVVATYRSNWNGMR